MIRDKNALHPGDLISTFMKTLGEARFGHRGLERQIPALALLHDRAVLPFTETPGRKGKSFSTALSRWCLSDARHRHVRRDRVALRQTLGGEIFEGNGSRHSTTLEKKISGSTKAMKRVAQ